MTEETRGIASGTSRRRILACLLVLGAMGGGAIVIVRSLGSGPSREGPTGSERTGPRVQSAALPETVANEVSPNDASPSDLRAAIRGLVLDPEGKPVPGSKVSLWSHGGVVIIYRQELALEEVLGRWHRDLQTERFWKGLARLSGETLSGPDGTFAFDRPPDGAYVVTVHPPERPDRDGGGARGDGPAPSIVGAGFRPAAASVQVPTDLATPLVLQFERGLSISGRVLGPEGEPAAGAGLEVVLDPNTFVAPLRDAAELALAREASLPRTTHSSADGTFRIEGLSNGKYCVRAGRATEVADPVCGVRGGSSDVEIRLSSTVHVSGRVTLRGGDPAPGVEVRFHRVSAEANDSLQERSLMHYLPEYQCGDVREPPATAVTTADGTFSADVLPGCLDLVAQGSGIQTTLLAGVILVTGEETLVIECEVGRRVTGRVLDPSGVPVEDAQVSAEWRVDSLRGMAYYLTATEGRFVLDGLPSCECELRVSAPGFSASRQLLKPDEADIEVVLEEAGIALRGCVRDATTGAPVARPRVLFEVLTRSSARIGGADGCFTLRNERSQAGDGSDTLRIVSATHVAYEQEIQYDLARGPSALEILIDRAGTIEGTVREVDGEPLVGVRVGFKEEEESWKLAGDEVTTGAGGAYRVVLNQMIEGGRYRASVEGEDERRIEELWVEIADPRESIRGVEIRVLRDAVISGTVRSGGRPLSGIEVNAVLRSPDAGADEDLDAPWASGSCSTDHRGLFEIGGLAPGSFVLHVDARGYIPLRSSPVVAAPGEPGQVDLDLKPGLTIGGRVRNQSGQPVGDVVLEARCNGESGAYTWGTRSARDGSYLLEGLEAGHYRLHITGTGYLSVDVAAVLAGSEGVDVGLEAAASLEVTAVEAGTETPIERFRARIEPGPDVAPEKAARAGWGVARSGRLRLEDIPAGDRRLQVLAPGSFLPVELPVSLVPGESANVRVLLSEGEVITGRVFDPVGAPLAGVRVLAFQAPLGTESGPRADSRATESWLSWLTPSASTGDDGSFRLAGLYPGRCRIEAKHRQFHETIAADVVVGDPGAPARVELRFPEDSRGD